MSRLIDADALLGKFNKKTDIWTALTDEDMADDFALYCKIADAVEEMPTIGGWISVKDRLPEKDGEYLIYVHYTRCGYLQLADFTTDRTKVNTFRSAGYGWSQYDDDYGHCDVGPVTHWMPLPEPPEEVSGDG